jgi:hypothetical protein
MRVQGFEVGPFLRRLCLAAPLLAGCSHEPPGSNLFHEGYTAGCSDGSFDAGGPSGQVEYMRDPALYRTQPDYKNGWQQGYAKCYRDQNEYPPMDSDN